MSMNYSFDDLAKAILSFCIQLNSQLFVTRNYGIVAIRLMMALTIHDTNQMLGLLYEVHDPDQSDL